MQQAVTVLKMSRYLRPRHWIALACLAVAMWMLVEDVILLVGKVQGGDVLFPWGWLAIVPLVAIAAVFGWAGWRLWRSPEADHLKLAVFLLVVCGYVIVPSWLSLHQENALLPLEVTNSLVNLGGFILANRVWAWICAWGMRAEEIEVGRFEFVRPTFLFFAAWFIALALSETVEWLDSMWGVEASKSEVSGIERELWLGMFRSFFPLGSGVLFYYSAKWWLIRHGACWAPEKGPLISKSDLGLEMENP